MKTTLSVYDFRDAFRKAGRAEQFSYDGLEILFDYLEQCEEDTGSDYELDVIELCCEFAEQNWQTIAADYKIELDENENEEEQEQQVIDHLTDEGVFIGTSESGIVYRQF
jgi:predicted ArsR family transcriptional regulator